MNFFCTVITWSHVPCVLALRDSLRASGNTEPLHVLLVDMPADRRVLDGEGLVWISLDELSPAAPPAMRHYFSAFELCNALKPFLVSHLFGRGAARVIYLDCDLLVTGSFAPVWARLDGASLLLTPHQLRPPPLDLPYSTEVDIVDQGLFNGGFTAWRATPAASRMLAWMRERLPRYGFADRAHGMFVDQKLLPLLAFYEPDEVCVVRDPRLNVAFWNAHERPVQDDGSGRWSIEGAPVVFFHLSGYRTSRPGFVCTYLPERANSALLARSPWMRGVLEAYRRLLSAHEEKHVAAQYPYSHYEGTRLTQDFRRLLFAAGKLDRATYAYWRIWTRERLRPIKHFVTRNWSRLFHRA